MDFSAIERRGLVLLGCGRMGTAMLTGWLAGGLDPTAVWAIEPKPSAWLADLPGVNLNADLPDAPAAVLIAVKPQAMGEALTAVAKLGGSGTLFLSVAAGVTIAAYESALGSDAAVVRAMPNTPAAIGKGISALVGNSRASEKQMAMAEGLLSSVGQTVRLEDENQMDAVTAVSGSGPAYVFLLVETLAAAGVEEGLPADLASRLAKATVAGAGALAETAEESPSRLRENVTSPQGTTAAALEVLMDDEAGLPALLRRAVKAAAIRSRELSG